MFIIVNVCLSSFLVYQTTHGPLQPSDSGGVSHNSLLLLDRVKRSRFLYLCIFSICGWFVLNLLVARHAVTVDCYHYGTNFPRSTWLCFTFSIVALLKALNGSVAELPRIQNSQWFLSDTPYIIVFPGSSTQMTPFSDRYVSNYVQDPGNFFTQFLFLHLHDKTIIFSDAKLEHLW